MALVKLAIFCFLSYLLVNFCIVGSGGECDSLHQVDTEKCLSRILESHDHIVGVKVRLQAAVALDGKNETEIYRCSIC